MAIEKDFRVKNGLIVGEGATIDGNVGIGTTSTTGKLNVAGNVAIADGGWYGFGDVNERIAGNNAGYLQFFTSGLEKVRIDSAGNVGIGTSSPTHNLHIVKNSGTNFFKTERTDTAAYFTIDHSSLFTNFDTNDRYVFKQNGTERMRIDSAGRVLIGTTSVEQIVFGGTGSAAIAQQTLYGTDSNSLGLLIRTTSTTASIGGTLSLGRSRSTAAGIVSNGDTTGSIQFLGADGSDLKQYTALIKSEVDGEPSTNDMPGRLVFSTTADGTNAPTERMRIDSAGNVGIGTSSPGNRLSVVSASAGDAVTFSNAGASNKIGYLYTDSQYVGLMTIGGAGNNQGILFDLNNNRTLIQRIGGTTATFAASGNVGIGTTTPAAKLQVEEVGIETTTTAITTTAETIVYSYPAATFRTAELMCQIVDSTNSQYHSTKFMVIHNSTDVWFNQTSVIHSHDELGTFTVNISGGNVRLLFTPVAATTKSVKVAATMLTS
jgi:hypothetical protein